jgi:CRISPR-associated endonuclease/helicase Cas3
LANVIQEAIHAKQKILIVCNRVEQAQELYKEMRDMYANVPLLLVHSRFKRADRNRLETDLRTTYNNSTEACIVISTQVVEVSLDISFDLMITACAPIDALIQRFGRINRKRTAETIGHYKPVYVLQPPERKADALPYHPETLQRTFDILPDGALFKERNVQELIDTVYSDIQFVDIDLNAVYSAGQWLIKSLWHHPKSALLETLDIDSVTCIDESDRALYDRANYSEQSKMEIPVSYRSVGYADLEKATAGSRPFVVPRKAYDKEVGFLAEFAKTEFYDVSSRFL